MEILKITLKKIIHILAFGGAAVEVVARLDYPNGK